MKPFVLLIAGLVLLGGVPTLPWPVPAVVVAPQSVTAVVYVYEKDEKEVPVGVTVALDKLNRAGIVANLVEADTTDGDGSIPDQFKPAMTPATTAGLPALVVLSGTNVVRVVQAPDTVEAVMEAAK